MTKLIKPTVANANDLERERVVVRFAGPVDLGDYAIFCCRVTDATTFASGAIPAVFWFPGKQIKKDDLVILYTKNGVRREKTGEDGVTSHFHYWGRSEPLWTPEYRAVLVNTSTWLWAEPQPHEISE